MDIKDLLKYFSGNDTGFDNLNNGGQNPNESTFGKQEQVTKDFANFLEQNPQVMDKIKSPESQVELPTKSEQPLPPVQEAIAGKVASTPMSDVIKTSQPAPLAIPTAASPKSPLDPYGNELNDAALKSAQENAQRSRMLGSLANAGSALGAAFSRGTVKPQDISKDFVESENQKVANIQQRREGKDKELTRSKHLAELEDETQMRDPNSAVSKNLRDGLKMVMPGMNIPENISGKQLRDSGINLGTLLNAKQAADARRDAAAERNTLAKEKAQEKKEAGQKLSDKQVEGINEFDDSIVKAQNVLDLLGKNSSWTGPVDAMVPDDLSGQDQVAFRSAVGRMQDAYRKLITGAGASNKEIARLEGRIPSVSDTYSNFQSKAKEFIKEIENAKKSHLKNYKNQGKNVSNFETASSESEKSSNSDMVRVVSPEGKQGMIPKANLKKALERGFKEI